MNHIVLFDGECNFCDRSVQFIIKRDKEAVFKFTSLQSDIGQEITRKHQVPGDIDSIIVVKDDKYYIKSAAALQICKHLSGGWKLLFVLSIIPKPIRDNFYDILAKNRYKWFGKNDRCMIPSPEIRNRFL
ncbi:thiol-disulfide oxidoreductase DCC family protein [Robertmurraya korlensis]|uniref:thiol-disulfide oxidoreductase DCC family protein n=1 Tax=Robertmurraya korlensis TaxID=519977 RepID=UPI0008252474|nr:thiol-disulfide oxidoreductase DCC family protein [Robertmurraya korlensis]